MFLMYRDGVHQLFMIDLYDRHEFVLSLGIDTGS